MRAWHHLPDLYFLHIPKTAGTSVRAWAEGLFPQDAILPVFHLLPMEELPDEAIRAARFASGHFGWRYVDRVEAAGGTVEVFTFLRDPVGLHMSLLAYAPHIPEDSFSHMSDAVAATARDLAQMVSIPKKIWFITEKEIDVEEYLRLYPGPVPGQNPCVLHLAGGGAHSDGLIEEDPAVVDKARGRMESMLSVGLVEDMAGSFAILCDRLGLPYLPLGRSLNKSEKKLQPSPSYSEVVRRRNEHDQALYDAASAVVGQRKADLLVSYGAASIDDLATPMRLAFLATDRGVERVNQADITMADGLVTEGFAQRFFHEPYQRWIRWAPKEATLFLPLDRGSDRTVRFEVGTAMSVVIRDGLTLSVDGRDTPLTRTYEQWPDGWHLICEATIPAGDEGLQYTALDFEAPEDVATEHPDSMGVRAAWALADISIS